MTLVRGFRGTAGGFSLTVARMAAAGLVITAIFAAVWTGPAASASSSAPRSPASAATSPASVKYYVVPRAGNGGAESLFTIAAKTLGNGNRYLEIFDLNKGRLQRDGGRLKSPQSIDAGWILELPANASGPGVHSGPLPGSTLPATPAASHRPSQLAAASSAGLPVGGVVAGGGALVVVAGAGLAVTLGRRSKRRGLHGRAPGARASGRASSAATARVATRVGQRAWQSGSYQSGRDTRRPVGQRSSFQGSVEPDDQGWPDASQGRPRPAGRPAPAAAGFQGQLTPDHPSWPGASYPNARDIRQPGPARGGHQDTRGAEHPSWAGDGYPRQAHHTAPPTAGFQGQLTPDHPSWPGASYPPHRDARQPAPPRGGYQGQLTPDHPSWPAASYPPARDARQPAPPLSGNHGQFGPEHPSWPGGDQRTQPRVIGGSAEPRPVSAFEVHHEPRGRTAPPGPMTGGQGMAQQARPPVPPPGSAQHLARPASPAAQQSAYQQSAYQQSAYQDPAYQDPAYQQPTHQPRHGRDPGGGQSQAVLTHEPRAGYEQAAVHGTELAVDQTGGMVDPVRQRVQELWNTDSFRLVERMLTEADDEATKIINTAEYEAAEMRQFAAERAAATLTAAEREAAELRAAVLKMTAELGGVAAYVTENLAIPTMPATRPAVRPAALPTAEPADQPAAKPTVLPGAAPDAESTTKPQARPAAKPASRSQPDATQNLTKPASPAKPTARPPAARPGVSPRRAPRPRTTAKPKARQVGAWHKMVAALIILFMVGLTSSAAEIGMHGLSFFVFRNAGAGAGNSHDLEENQGPGQADARGAHHKAQAKPHAKPHPGKPNASPSGKASKAK